MLAVDTYGTSETARLLGVSPKRVRQMVAAGQLAPVSSNPYRFAQQEVHDLRDKRRSDKRTNTAAASTNQPQPIQVTELSALVEQLVEQSKLAARYEITAEANQQLQAERDALASRVAQLEQQISTMRPRRFRRRSN